MRTIRRLEHLIRDHAWGSRTAIAGMLSKPEPAKRPQAELWMGAHPAAPSQVRLAGRSVSIAERVTREPEAILGRAWIPCRAARHPRNAGVLAPVILRYLCLAPSEAIFLAPGELHGDLGGFGIEVMASSDDVARDVGRVAKPAA